MRAAVRDIACLPETGRDPLFRFCARSEWSYYGSLDRNRRVFDAHVAFLNVVKLSPRWNRLKGLLYYKLSGELKYIRKSHE